MTTQQRFLRFSGTPGEWSEMTDEQIEEIMCAQETESPEMEHGLNFPRSVMMGFLEGYHRGLTWPDRWEYSPYTANGKPNPGGPYVHQMRDPKDSWRWITDPVSAAANASWRRGWKYGHDMKLAEGRKNPMPDGTW